MNLPGVLTAVLLVGLGAAAPQQPVGLPADFAFRFEFKPCFPDAPASTMTAEQ